MDLLISGDAVNPGPYASNSHQSGGEDLRKMPRWRHIGSEGLEIQALAVDVEW